MPAQMLSAADPLLVPQFALVGSYATSEDVVQHIAMARAEQMMRWGETARENGARR